MNDDSANSLISVTDANEVNKTCVAYAYNCSNLPSGFTNYGYLTTLYAHASYIKQTYTPYSSDFKFVRIKNVTWGDWKMEPRHFAGYVGSHTTVAQGNWSDVGYIIIPASGSTYFTDLIGSITATTSWNSGKPLNVSISFSTNPNYGSCQGENKNGLYYGCSATMNIYSSASADRYIYFHEILASTPGDTSIYYSGWYKYVPQNEYYIGNTYIS